jgi:hypothetical protein
MKLSEIILGCAKSLELYDEASRLIVSAKEAKETAGKIKSAWDILQELRKKAHSEKTQPEKK